MAHVPVLFPPLRFMGFIYFKCDVKSFWTEALILIKMFQLKVTLRYYIILTLAIKKPKVNRQQQAPFFGRLPLSGDSSRL